MPKSELLKEWVDWSAGLGFPVDDGRTPGWHFGVGMRGQVGCLAPTRATEYTTVGFEDYNANHAIATFNTGNSGAYAAVSFMSDSPNTTGTSRGTAQSTSNTAANTNSQSFTVPAGTDILCIVVMNDAARTVTEVTFDTTQTWTAATGDEIIKNAEGTDGTRRVTIFTLNDADDDGTFDGTSNTLLVNFSGVCDSVVTLFTINGALYKTKVSVHDGDGSTLDIGASATFETHRNLNAYQSGHVVVGLATTQDRTGLGSEFTNILEDGDADDLFANVVERVPDVPVDQGDTVGHVYSTYQYFFEENVGVNSWSPYLYAMRGVSSGNASPVVIEKFSTSTTNISYQGASHKLSIVVGATAPTYPGEPAPDIPGQPARYQGFWYFPAGNDYTPFKLTAASGTALADTLSVTAAGFTSGADHFVILGHQLAGVVENGVNAGGIRILDLDGTPTTDAQWGPVFEAGDRTKRAQGLASVEGLAFILNADGLYSFNNTGRAGLVWEDFRGWIDLLENVTPKAYSGGLLLPHPSGLYFWSVGGLPINVSLDRYEWTHRPANSLVTDFTGGRHHSITILGDYVYAIYQPNFTSQTVYVLCGYKHGGPNELSWVVLDSFTATPDLNSSIDAAMVHGIGASLACRLSNGDTQAAVVYGVGGDLAYIRLDQHGTPFERPISSVPYTPRTSANAWMSEIAFPTDMKLDRIVVYTRNLVAGTDSFVLSRVADDDGIERTIGSSIISNGRNVRDLNGLICTTFSLNVTYAGGSAHSSLPMITRIELWGSPVNNDR